jgi:hypothetical protein
VHSIDPLDPAAFDPTRMARLRHDFHRHPLLQVDALAALARRLMPHGNCRFVRPGMKADSPFDHKPAPTDGRSLDDVLANLEQPGAWLAIYDAQQDATYREVLGEVGAHIQRIVAPWQRVHDVRSFLFVSAPPSVTPFHIDRENNFWLQIRGRKKLTLWDHRDAQVVAPHDVERFILQGTLQGITMRDGTRERGVAFPCGPGDGVYFPSTTPHMTETDPADNGGDTLSISVGMVFYTDVTRRDAGVHMWNRQARALGLRPRPPGGSPFVDRAKSTVGRVLWKLSRFLPDKR